MISTTKDGVWNCGATSVGRLGSALLISLYHRSAHTLSHEASKSSFKPIHQKIKEEHNIKKELRWKHRAQRTLTHTKKNTKKTEPVTWHWVLQAVLCWREAVKILRLVQLFGSVKQISPFTCANASVLTLFCLVSPLICKFRGLFLALRTRCFRVFPTDNSSIACGGLFSWNVCTTIQKYSSEKPFVRLFILSHCYREDQIVL